MWQPKSMSLGEYKWTANIAEWIITSLLMEKKDVSPCDK